MSKKLFISLILLIISALAVGILFLPYTIDQQAPESVQLHGINMSHPEQIHINGHLVNPNEPYDYSDVYICTFNSDGRMLYSKNVGDLPPVPEQLNISIKFNHTPEYIVIWSDEFWQSEKKPYSVTYYNYEVDRRIYRSNDAMNKNDFPINVHESNCAQS
jgi:hypothetical protein